MSRLSVAWMGEDGGQRDKLGRGGGFKSGDKFLCFPDAPILKEPQGHQLCPESHHSMAGRGELMWHLW